MGSSAVAGTRSGIVRCTAARQAVQVLPAGHGFGPVSGQSRLFAPIREAVFFSRAGDRCAWHPGGPVRG